MISFSFQSYYKYFLLALCCLSTSFLAAQITFQATADAKQIVENEYLEVTFTLNNAQGRNFKAPNFKGFDVISGPSTSNSISIVNGARTSKQGFVYTIQPKKIGNYTIGPASVVVNGKTLRSKPISVQVLKGKQVAKGGKAEEELYVKAEIDTNEVYVGQQVMVNYKLYTTVDIENYDIVKETDYAGFYAHDVRRFNSRVVREVIDGVQYTTKVLKRVALFPQQTGLLKVEPMGLRLGIIVGRKRRNSFFFNNQIRHTSVNTNALAINVKELPSPTPPDFSGAVGNYSIAFNLGKNKVTTDDAISIKLAIRGDGDIKRLQPPAIALPTEFELYEPKILQENSKEVNGKLSGYKEIEYLILPKRPNTYKVSPSFTYFHPDSAKYIRLQPKVFTIAVSPGSGLEGAGITTAPVETTKDIRYIKSVTSFSKRSQPFANSGWFYSLCALPFLLFGGAVFYKKQQDQHSTIDIAILKSRRAQKVAKERLQTANQLLKEQKSRAFYDEISKALLGYVGDKLRIPLSELSKENVREKLQSLKVTPSYIEDVTSIIKTTEMALFAGMDNSASMQEIYDKSVNILSSIEEELT